MYLDCQVKHKCAHFSGFGLPLGRAFCVQAKCQGVFWRWIAVGLDLHRGHFQELVFDRHNVKYKDTGVMHLCSDIVA